MFIRSIICICVIPSYLYLQACELNLKTSDDISIKSIDASCEDGTFYEIELSDVENLPVVKISKGKSAKDLAINFISINYNSTNKGAQLSIGNTTYTIDEFDDLLDIEEPVLINHFIELGRLTRLIHDFFEFKAWESPAVMLLYSLGIAVEKYQTAVKSSNYDTVTTDNSNDDTANNNIDTTIANNIDTTIANFRSKRAIDVRIFEYIGPIATLPCENNGTGIPEANFTAFTEDSCPGLCGPSCSCWKYVCGDCCVHTGCSRHDAFCRGSWGLLSGNCFTLRGILWDTLTDITYDC